MNLLTFKHRAFRTYKEDVNGNENITYLEAQKKMTRNYILSHKFPKNPNEPNKQLCQYGSLQFLVIDGERIVWMKNRCKLIPDWKRSKVRYLFWSKKLGIQDSHSLKQLIDKDKSYKQYYAAKGIIQ